MKKLNSQGALRKPVNTVNKSVSSSNGESQTLPLRCSKKTAPSTEKAKFEKPTSPHKTEHGGYLDSSIYSVYQMKQVQSVSNSEDYMSLYNYEQSRYYRSLDSSVIPRLQLYSTDKAVEKLSDAFCTRFKKTKTRLITQDKLVDTIEALNDVKFTEFWPQVTQLKNLMEQRWTDESSRQLDAINSDLKKLNRKLFVKLMAVVYDTKKEAKNSSNIRINNALFDELQATLNLKSMCNEHFVNSILLYFLYCLNQYKAEKVYATINEQTLSR